MVSGNASHRNRPSKGKIRRRAPSSEKSTRSRGVVSLSKRRAPRSVSRTRVLRARGILPIVPGTHALIGMAGPLDLSKVDVKEALMDRLGAPKTVEESRRLGACCSDCGPEAARGCPAAVIDSTWFPYARSLVRDLPGPCVEVRCRVSVELARERCRARQRDERHLDASRAEEELWGYDVSPLGVGPLINVDKHSR